MKLLLKPAATGIFILSLLGVLSFSDHKKREKTAAIAYETVVPLAPGPKIQAAILLDVSGSMDGLIEQAKAQLWNMVTVMGKAQCNDITPQIEIALYEYGRTTNSEADGYVKQISGFTGDLDMLSKNLFSLNTNGGDEFCGQVIYSSLKELRWDPSPESYKVIFIAGNEDFLQGNLLYTKACGEAKNKAVIVNTIYCGDRLQGIREHWNLSSECGNGSFTVINHNEKIDDIPTPYDSMIISLNDKLNSTYMAYGSGGAKNLERQTSVDKMNYSVSKGAALKRVAVKSNPKLYKNESWDLVDAAGDDEKFVETLDKKNLPDSLKTKSTVEIKEIIAAKKEQRLHIQKQIESASTDREVFISAARKKNAGNNRVATLETEIEKIIKEQAKRFKMTIH